MFLESLKECMQCGGLLVCLAGEGSWAPAQDLCRADYTGQNTFQSCEVVRGC